MFDSVFSECAKCGGLGTIEAYRHRSNGVCYQCKGTGKLTATGEPIQELIFYQWTYINKAKQELETLGYYNTNEVLDAIDFMMLADILNAHRQEIELKKKRAIEATATSDNEFWTELFGEAIN